jgi:Phage terminase large subunit (GpA)
MARAVSQDDLELYRCADDPAYFCNEYGVIDDSQNHGGELKGITRFRLWPRQFPVMWALETQRLVLILKARQLGISWLVCAYVLWKILFHPNQVVILLSKGKAEANELLRRVKALYERLPDSLRSALPRISPDRNNKSEVQWSNGSLVLSMAATENAGISYTASLVVMDEAAHMRWAAKLYANIKPTIDAEGNQGGQLVVLSTANGLGGFFHNLWTKTVEGVSGFTAVFLPWWARPGRDTAWYDRMVREAEDPRLVPQNYPANPIEAFLASSRSRFLPDWIAKQLPHLREPLDPADWPDPLRWRPGWDGATEAALPHLWDVPGVLVYTPPVAGRPYLVGADTAEGKEEGDWNDGVVIDAETWEEVASVHNHAEPDEFADHLMALSEPYQAAVIVERNNHGHAVIGRMKRVYFPRLALGHDGDYGWATTPKTKPAGIDLLAECLRKELITVRSKATLPELQVYSRLKGGKLGAPAGYYDDRVMAWYVALSYRRLLDAQPKWVEPRAMGEPARIKGVLR